VKKWGKLCFFPFYQICCTKIIDLTTLFVIKWIISILDLHFWERIITVCVYKFAKPKALFTRDILLTILRKKDIIKMSLGQGKLLSNHNTRETRFYKSLPWLFNWNLLLKNVKCRNIFLSQYCVQKILCVSRA